jgi:DNA-binding cell septation regulator SpoVG
MEQRITDIQIVPIKPKNGLVGFVSLIFDNSFYFGNIGIRTRISGGFRLSYPTRMVGTASVPIYHPLNKEISDMIEQEVIAKYEEMCGKLEE